MKAAIEKALAAWAKGGDKPSFDYPTAARAPGRRRSILSTSRAPRSRSFNIGLPGPPRNTPDYFALQVLNTILGGQFQSRLNANIREQKGYSYGVNSSFAYGKGPGLSRRWRDLYREDRCGVD